MSGPEQEEDDDAVVILVTEEGEEIAFEILDIIEVDGERYALLTPYDEDDDGADDEDDDEGLDVHIFSYDEDDNGEPLFGDVDPEKFDKIRDAAMAAFGSEDGEGDEDDA